MVRPEVTVMNWLHRYTNESHNYSECTRLAFLKIDTKCTITWWSAFLKKYIKKRFLLLQCLTSSSLCTSDFFQTQPTRFVGPTTMNLPLPPSRRRNRCVPDKRRKINPEPAAASWWNSEKLKKIPSEVSKTEMKTKHMGGENWHFSILNCLEHC